MYHIPSSKAGLHQLGYYKGSTVFPHSLACLQKDILVHLVTKSGVPINIHLFRKRNAKTQP